MSEKAQKILKKRNIITAHQTTNKIKTTIHTRLKDKIPLPQQRNLIYAVPCGTCRGENKVYVGQTSQPLQKRLSQHQYSVKTGLCMTGLSQHTIEEGHKFDFEGTRVLDKIENSNKRQVAEMLHIKLNNTVNLQREAMGFSHMYDGVVGKLKEMSRENKTRHTAASAVNSQTTQQA